jgi:hypothetical protein
MTRCTGAAACETGVTARLEPATIDGLVYASSMVNLYAARHRLPVPALARWLLALGIIATLAANMAQGWSHGPVGAVIAAWPAVSLVGSYELSPGVLSPLHDVVLKRFTKGFCNTSAKCGARCRCCSEPCPPRTYNMRNTLNCRRRRTYPLRPARSAGTHAMPALHPERMSCWSGSSGPPWRASWTAGQPRTTAGRSGTSLRLAAVQEPDQPSGSRGPVTAASQSGDINAAAVAAYRASVQAGQPLSERKLAGQFGNTSRRGACNRMAEARQTPAEPGTGLAPQRVSAAGAETPPADNFGGVAARRPVPRGQ